MFISAQVSLYPLRQTYLTPAISQAMESFRRRGLEITPGPMSTVVAGEDEALFEALKEAFQQSAADNDLVMIVTLSNTCPVESPD